MVFSQSSDRAMSRQVLGGALCLLMILGTLSLGSCGAIKAGAAPPATDPAPTGTIEAQGSLLGQNGVTASGSVSVYNSGTSQILRLDNLSIPINSGNQIFLEVSGQVVFTTILKSASGNQDYDTGLTAAQTWTQATIRTSSNTNNPAIAIAVLLKP